jgi:catechol 2,3-dioxygenase-like lactoylglutathione lyase family enzyme
MIPIKGVVHFSIPVSDIEASRRFYTEILGLKHFFTPPGGRMTFLKAGEDHVILVKSETRVERSAWERRYIHHAFKVDAADYDAAKAFLTAKGVEIFEEENRARGVFVGRQCYVRDPDGNTIEISEWDGTSILEPGPG